jgi:hypothetical protein
MACSGTEACNLTDMDGVAEGSTSERDRHEEALRVALAEPITAEIPSPLSATTVSASDKDAFPWTSSEITIPLSVTLTKGLTSEFEIDDDMCVYVYITQINILCYIYICTTYTHTKTADNRLKTEEVKKCREEMEVRSGRAKKLEIYTVWYRGPPIHHLCNRATKASGRKLMAR